MPNPKYDIRIRKDEANNAEDEILKGYIEAIFSPTIVMCNEDYSIKEGLMGSFEIGELVTIKGITFKVAYVNGVSVTFERVKAIIL